MDPEERRPSKQSELHCLRDLVKSHEARIHDLMCQLGAANERAHVSSEWRRSVDEQLRHIRAELKMLAEGQERMKGSLMAQIDDLKTAVGNIGDDLTRIADDVKKVLTKLMEPNPDITAAVETLKTVDAGLDAAADAMEAATNPPPTPPVP